MQPEREWVGLRPGRRSVRLEYEEAKIGADNTSDTLRVVHNYGVSRCQPIGCSHSDLLGITH